MQLNILSFTINQDSNHCRHLHRHGAPGGAAGVFRARVRNLIMVRRVENDALACSGVLLEPL